LLEAIGYCDISRKLASNEIIGCNIQLYMKTGWDKFESVSAIPLRTRPLVKYEWKFLAGILSVFLVLRNAIQADHASLFGFKVFFAGIQRRLLCLKRKKSLMMPLFVFIEIMS
jgi:hypothetical protein